MRRRLKPFRTGSIVSLQKSVGRCSGSQSQVMLLRTRGDAPGECQPSVSYHAAPWEHAWRANISALARAEIGWNVGCQEILKDRKRIDEWLRASEAMDGGSSYWSRKTFSYHAVKTCTGESFKVPIEPLVGLLRHPLFHCLRFKGWRPPDHPQPLDDRELIFNTSYLLPSWRAEVQMLQQQPVRSALFFDCGASTWSVGAHFSSQRWFYETYLRRGIAFDRIFAWEAGTIPPSRIFSSSMPESVYDAISYYNVPLNATVGHVRNPLRTLQAVARSEDFVVLKIDFDTPSIEHALIDQILASPKLTSLVDELYFEQHVYDSPLNFYRWATKVRPDQAHLSDSYELFTRLRHAGIRAHSWI